MSALAEHLWQSTLCAGLIWLAAKVLRNDGAALRHWLWCLASYKFLVPFAVLSALGGRIDLSVALPVQVFAESAQGVASIVAPAEQISALRLAPDGFAVALLCIWISGSLFVLLRWLLAGWQAHCIRRDASVHDFGLTVPVGISRDISDPAVIGIFHPMILLPKRIAANIAREHLESVLAHEMWHVKRHDNLKCSVHAVVEILFWFHPLVWWIGERLLEERERACDEAVIDDGHENHKYAEAILRVCRLAQPTERAWMLRAAGGNLKQRIEQILGPRRRMSSDLKNAAIALFGAAMFTMPVVAGAMFSNGSALHGASTVLMPGLGRVTLTPVEPNRRGSSLTTDEQGIHLHNSGIRELVGLAYDVDTGWIRLMPALERQRFDVHFASSVANGGALQPRMYRDLITVILAREFNIEIYVNQRCQAPCGRSQERSQPADWPVVDVPQQVKL